MQAARSFGYLIAAAINVVLVMAGALADPAEEVAGDLLGAVQADVPNDG